MMQPRIDWCTMGLMKALVFTEYGNSEVIKIRAVETPIPGDDEVLVEV